MLSRIALSGCNLCYDLRNLHSVMDAALDAGAGYGGNRDRLLYVSCFEKSRLDYQIHKDHRNR